MNFMHPLSGYINLALNGITAFITTHYGRFQMTKRGRPHGTYGLTPKKIRLFCEAIAELKTLKDACKAAEISPNAFYRYRNRCEATEDGILADFWVAYTQALKDAGKARKKKTEPILRRQWNRSHRRLKKQFGYRNFEEFRDGLPKG